MKKIKTQEALQKEKPNVSVSHDAVAEHQLEKTTSNKTESSTMTSSVTPAHEQYGRVISEDVNPVQAMPDATGQTLPGDAAITELVESKGFMKRKRSMTDDTSLTSSLLDPRDTPPPKRIRADNGAMRVREIPSTPDRSPLQTRRAPLTPIKNEVIESPEDGFSGAKEEDHDNDMVLVEVRYVNMESEEEQEVEEDDEDETQESDDPFLPGRPASQSLSEPEPAFPKGKSTLRDSGEMLDLDVPSPEGGWDEDEAPAQPIPDSDLENPESNTLRPDTQALLQNTVPAYDFTVPEPDEGWDAFLPAPPSSPPIPLSSPEAAASPPVILMPEKEMLAQLEAWMDAHVESGIAIEVVGFALKCTNNEPDLADLVLASLRNGHGVPEDIRGVWTQSDDEGLEAVDARLVRAVIAKHGREGLDARYEFLKVYNEA
ncbi:hypothetical protein MMC19_000324 [Ptychographa xylographoides]|nr:hypothetical protein [Ptychographa xylographoides]